MTPGQTKPTFLRPGAKPPNGNGGPPAATPPAPAPRASPLQGVISGRRPQPRRTFIYGVGGIGKSSFAAKSDAPIFLDLEDGLGDIDCARFPLPDTFKKVEDAIASLQTEDHEFKTIVIDGVEILEQLIWAQVCADGDPQNPKKKILNIEGFGYGRGYTIALAKWRWLLESLDALRRHRGMGAILIGHSKIEKFEAPDTQNYDRYMPRVHKQAAALLMEWADEVFFATWGVFVHGDEERQKGKAVGTGERILRTVEQPFAMAKNRLGMKEDIPLEWAEYAKHFQGAVKEDEVTA